MPPKKGKGKGKDKKGKKGEASPVGDEGPIEPPEPTEKEKLLKDELESLTTQLGTLKKRVEDLRKENEWLQDESHRIRLESHEYMSYMTKKTDKRQSTIVTLTDQNRQEIDLIHKEKKEMLKEYEQKKQALKNILMEKEAEISKTRKELADLEEFKRLQTDQVARIKELEKEVIRKRGRHTDTVQRLKSQFLKEKREYMHDSETKVQNLAREANREAVTCLNRHTEGIKQENNALRKELMALIQKARALEKHRIELEEQQIQLLREKQYAEDLKRLHYNKQQKMLETFGPVTDQ